MFEAITNLFTTSVPETGDHRAFARTSDKLNTPNSIPMNGANGSTRRNLSSVGTYSVQRGGKRRRRRLSRRRSK